jgi:hypothetical protein
MNPVIAQQLLGLQQLYPKASAPQLPSGAHLITVPEVPIPGGWNQQLVTILFLTSPAYPGAQPDCFWAVPAGIRLQNGAVPQNSNDTNPIPEIVPATQATWFSWHVQQWNPNRDSLLTYLNVILNRFRSLQ